MNKMKIAHGVLAAAAVIALSLTTAYAVTPARLATTADGGVATFANDANYVVWKPLRIDAVGIQPSSNAVTVSVVQDGITNVIGSGTASSGAVGIVITNTSYVFKGGVITVNAGTNSTAIVRVISEVYP